MGKRRRFGAIRRLPSGRYQARYRDRSGRLHAAPGTFETEGAADTYLASVETDLNRGQWIDPRAGRIILEKYSDQGLANRPDLANATRRKYSDLLRLHINPTFGSHELAGVEPSAVRGWWAELSQRHPTTAAKAYRLLNSIYRTAISDGVVARNPCQVKGGGTENAPERPTVSVAEVNALTEAMPERLRCIVLLAAWCGLRSGELTALRRKDLDVLHGFVNVRESMEQLHDGTISFKVPKTKAGRRRVAIPSNITEDLAHHLAMYVEPDPEALVFTGKSGGPLRHHVLHKYWDTARQEAGVPALHFHDLRHTSNTWAAATGASTAELMMRMGHASPRAALLYQHATSDRDQVLADALAKLAEPHEAPVIPIQQRT